MLKEVELSRDGSLVDWAEVSEAAATLSQCLHGLEALVDSADLASVADSVEDSRVLMEAEAVAGFVAVSVAVEAAAASEAVILALAEIETASADHPAGHLAEHHLVLEATVGTAIAASLVDMTREVAVVSMTDLVADSVTVADPAIVMAVVAPVAIWSLSDVGMVGIANEIEIVTVTVTATATGTATGKETEAVVTTTDRVMTIAESVDMKAVTRIPESCDDTKCHVFFRGQATTSSVRQSKSKASRITRDTTTMEVSKNLVLFDD